MNEKEKFFIKETQEHVNNVRKFINLIVFRLRSRAILHDRSKFSSPEKEIFMEMTPKLKASTYNSPEYKEFLKEMKVALDHHYKKNRHHPNFFENGINGMNLIDLIELFCDWKAATLRHHDGDLNKSIEENTDRFQISPQLVDIFKNSIELFDSKYDHLSCINVNEPIIEINHKNLSRFGGSPYKSVCPKCEEGLLLIYRDQKSLVLQEYDRCVLCGQQFKYKDIQELRRAEGNEHGIDSEKI